MKWKMDYRLPQVAHTQDMTTTIRLGTNLKVILAARGISLKRLSEETGIPYSTLHTWLENRQPKDILKVKMLAEYLQMDLDDLIFGDSRKAAQDTELPGSGSFEGVYEVTIRRRGRL